MIEVIAKSRSPKAWILFGLSGVLVVGILLYWYIWNSKFVSTDSAYVETDLSPVNSRIMGYVREVMVSENQEVKRGQSLLKLDDSDVKIEAGFKEAKFKKASADAKRAQILGKEHAVSDSDLEMAEATLTGVKADLDGSHLKMKFTEVISPIDGIVAKRSAQTGQFVQPGQTLFVIVPSENAWIKANFKESQVRLLKVGQEVVIHVDAYPGETWKGKIDAIFPSSVASLSLLPPENSTGNFTKVVQRFAVKISFEQKKDLRLLPGMSVEPVVLVK